MNQHQELHQREVMHDESINFAKLGRQKWLIGWAKYVCKWDMYWRNFCVSSLVSKNVQNRSKSKSKRVPFSNWIFKIRKQYGNIFQKKVLVSTLEDPILHNDKINPFSPNKCKKKKENWPIWVPVTSLAGTSPKGSCVLTFLGVVTD